MKTASSDVVRFLVGVVALCGLASGLARAQAPSNFVQIRGFYPFENGDFSSAPALDASLRLPLGGAASFGLKLEALTVLRQRGQVDLRLEQVFVGLSFRNEPIEGLAGRSVSLAGLLLYDAPEPQALLTDASLGYSLEAERPSAGQGLTGYELHTGDANLSGTLARQWTWSARYALSSDLNPVRDRTTHTGDAWLRTTLLEPLTLGVGLGLRARDGRVIYQGSLEGSVNLSDQDALGVRVTLTTAPGDEQRLFYDTTRLAPLTLGIYVGRSSESALIWGASVAAAAGSGLQFQGVYDGGGLGIARHEFSLGVRYGRAATSLALRGGMNLELDPVSGLWFGRLLGQLTANLSLERFSVDLTTRIDYGVDRLVGTLKGNAVYLSLPWMAIFSADLKISPALTGELALQGLYFFRPNIALNLTGAYRWQLPPSASALRFGIGLRYEF